MHQTPQNLIKLTGDYLDFDMFEEGEHFFSMFFSMFFTVNL